MTKLRYATCCQPGCGELAGPRGYCPAHSPAPWSGRTGATRRSVLGVGEGTWARLCGAARRRDRVCRRCRRGPTDEVDHLVPTAWRRPPAHFGDHLAGLVCLCRRCHAVKTNREAILGRTYGSPPPAAVIDRHVAWWLDQLDGVTRAAL